MRILGLCGRARAGKTTIAGAFKTYADSLGLNAQVFELSSYVINDLILTGDIPFGSTRETTPINLMVERGTQIRFQLPYYWIDKMREDIQAKSPDIAIVPNIRFLNEASHVQAYNYDHFKKGIVIRVKRLLRDGVEFISPDRDPNHISETEQNHILADYTLINQSGKEDLLVRQARTLLGFILEGK